MSPPRTGLEGSDHTDSRKGTPLLSVCVVDSAPRNESRRSSWGRGRDHAGNGALTDPGRSSRRRKRERVTGTARFFEDGEPVKISGYEIHMGETIGMVEEFLGNLCSDGTGGHTADTKEDGCICKMFRTYVHGVFDTEEMQTASS